VPFEQCRARVSSSRSKPKLESAMKKKVFLRHLETALQSERSERKGSASGGKSNLCISQRGWPPSKSSRTATRRKHIKHRPPRR